MPAREVGGKTGINPSELKPRWQSATMGRIVVAWSAVNRLNPPIFDSRFFRSFRAHRPHIGTWEASVLNPNPDGQMLEAFETR